MSKNHVLDGLIDKDKLVLQFKRTVRIEGLSRLRFKVRINGSRVALAREPKLRKSGKKIVIMLRSAAQEGDIVLLKYKDPKGDQERGVIQDLNKRDQKSLDKLGVRNKTLPEVALKERETPIKQSFLPSWMKSDKFNRRGGRDFSITGEGRITNARKSGSIGSGGNYLEKGAGAALFLLKSGGGNVPVTAGDPGSKYLVFSTNGSGKDRDRAEYAPTYYGFKTSGYFEFGKSQNISFDLRIPTRSSTTYDFYYLVQWWQGDGIGPIAGIRVKRGTSHTLQFIERSTLNSSRSGLDKADVITEYSLRPGEWKRLSINYNISPSNPGFFYINIDGTRIGSFEGNIGSLKSGGRPNAAPKSYRVKFGIYKASEPSIFRADYDNFTIA